MIILCYPGCSTCKKALDWLNQKNLQPEYRNIKEQNPSAQELALWRSKSQVPLKKLFNTSGQLYREMNLSQKLGDMSEEEQLQILASNGMLVKRPLLVGEDFFLVGFKAPEWEGTLADKEPK